MMENYAVLEKATTPAKIMTVIPRVNTILFNLYALCEITEEKMRNEKCKPEIYDFRFSPSSQKIFHLHRSVGQREKKLCT
jgi:hypothetical protein